MDPQESARINQEVTHSQRAVNEIDELLKFGPFQRFMARCQAEADSMANSVLHGDMDREKREATRIRRLGWLDVLAKLHVERDTHVGILQTNGITLKTSDQDRD